jgi:hypothetical protein
VNSASGGHGQDSRHVHSSGTRLTEAWVCARWPDLGSIAEAP